MRGRRPRAPIGREREYYYLARGCRRCEGGGLGLQQGRETREVRMETTEATTNPTTGNRKGEMLYRYSTPLKTKTI